MDNPACFRAEQSASGWVFTDNHGVPFTQLWQHVPALAPLYSTFENTFNAYAYSTYARDNFHVALALVTAYAVAVFLGPKLMANFGPFEAKRCVRSPASGGCEGARSARVRLWASLVSRVTCAFALDLDLAFASVRSGRWLRGTCS